MTTTFTPYYQQLQPGMAVQQMQPQHAEQLGALQQIVFPTLAADEWIRAEQFLHHLQIFPEGQFVVTHNSQVVGMTSCMRANFSTEQHTFKEISAGGWFSNHDPSGDWLYGLDMGVHPEYRGQGLARHLYRARHQVAKTLGLKGQFTVGMMNGYGVVADIISAEQYFEELKQGKRTDPTISAQMRIGFEPVSLVPNYLSDPTCANYGVLIKIDIDKKI
jgi:ribosomal protein S18 acetylase RimI-like enzyme